MIELINRIINCILLRNHRLNMASEKFRDIIQSEAAEDFLVVLLDVMALSFCLDKEFRKNIEGFEAKMLFVDKSGEIHVAAIFDKGRLKVRKKSIEDPTIKVIFKGQAVLKKSLMSPKMDILSPLLNQEISTEGNLNYMYKFGFMTTALKHKFLPLTNLTE